MTVSLLVAIGGVVGVEGDGGGVEGAVTGPVCALLMTGPVLELVPSVGTVRSASRPVGTEEEPFTAGTGA